jgi:hypothetical protein
VLAQLRNTALKAGKTKYMRIIRNAIGDRSDLRGERKFLKRLLTLSI